MDNQCKDRGRGAAGYDDKRKRRSHAEVMLAKARRLIERDSVDWYGFCSSIGQIPDNVAHMRGIQERFTLWLDGDDGA